MFTRIFSAILLIVMLPVQYNLNDGRHLLYEIGLGGLEHKGEETGKAIVSDGASWQSVYPLGWYNGGVFLGRAAEIDVQGGSVFSTLNPANGRVTLTINASPQVQDEGIVQGNSNIFNFVGAGVQVSSAWDAFGSNIATVQIPGFQGLPVRDEGILLGNATSLNFTGAGVTTSIAAGVVTVNIPNAGGGSIAWQNGGVPLGNVNTVNVTGNGGYSNVTGSTATITLTRGIEVLNNGSLLGSFTELDFVGGGVTAYNWGNGQARIQITGGSGSGGVAIVNQGGGIGLAIPGSGFNLAHGMRSIKAGAGILATIDVDNSLLITNTGGGGGGGNVSMTNATGGGVSTLFNPGVGNSFQFRPLVGINGINVINQGTYIEISGAGGGGGGAVTSVSSGNPNVLTVFPTTGSVVITPNGATGNLIPTVNGAGNLLSDYQLVVENGIIKNFALVNRAVAGGTGGGGITSIGTNNPTALTITSPSGPGTFIDPNFGGTGVANTFSRSDHSHNFTQSGGNVTGTISGSTFTLNAPTGGTGNITMQNIGFGFALLPITGTGSNFNVKTIAAGTNVTINDSGTQLTINAVASGGGTPLTVGGFPNITSLNFSALGGTTVNVSASGGTANVEIGVAGGAGVSSLNGLTGAVNISAGSNINFTPLGNGWQINATASGGGLTGTSGNGLTVTASTVSLALASTLGAGALPQLSGNAAQFLNGVGQWAVPPSGLTGTSGNGLTVTANTVSLALASGTNAGAFVLPYSGEAASSNPIMILKNTHGGTASVLRLDAQTSLHVLEIIQNTNVSAGSIVEYLGILVNGVRRKIALYSE